MDKHFLFALLAVSNKMVTPEIEKEYNYQLTNLVAQRYIAKLVILKPNGPQYQTDEKGKVFLEALTKMPHPVQSWVMPVTQVYNSTDEDFDEDDE